jgi:hypothetical protein
MVLLVMLALEFYALSLKCFGKATSQECFLKEVHFKPIILLPLAGRPVRVITVLA